MVLENMGLIGLLMIYMIKLIQIFLADRQTHRRTDGLTNVFHEVLADLKLYMRRSGRQEICASAKQFRFITNGAEWSQTLDMLPAAIILKLAFVGGVVTQLWKTWPKN